MLSPTVSCSVRCMQYTALSHHLGAVLELLSPLCVLLLFWSEPHSLLTAATYAEQQTTVAATSTELATICLQSLFSLILCQTMVALIVEEHMS